MLPSTTITSGCATAISRSRNGLHVAASSGSRRAIARRATAIDVTDQHFFAFQTDGFDDLGEQLSGAADEWPCLGVFIGARSFADKHQSRFAITFGVDHVCAFEMQRATSAVADFGVDLFERFG